MLMGLKLKELKRRIKMPKYKMNDVLYLLHGSQIAKCVVDEIIEHHTQKEEIIKYLVRPYGLKNFATVDEADLYETYAEVLEIAKNAIEESYKQSLGLLDKLTEEKFDEREKAYQESLKEEENV